MAEREDVLTEAGLDEIDRRLGWCPGRIRLNKAEAAKLIAAAREGLAARWRPIESAPKDGTVIIVSGGLAYWRDDVGQWYTITGEEWPGKPIEWPVTHWKQLGPSFPPHSPARGEAEENPLWLKGIDYDEHDENGLQPQPSPGVGELHAVLLRDLADEMINFYKEMDSGCR